MIYQNQTATHIWTHIRTHMRGKENFKTNTNTVNDFDSVQYVTFFLLMCVCVCQQITWDGTVWQFDMYIVHIHTRITSLWTMFQNSMFRQTCQMFHYSKKRRKKRFYVIDIWYDIRFRDDIFFYSFVVFIEKVFISFTWILVFIIMHISKNEGDFISFFSHLNWNWRRFNLVVSHITWSCTEFRIALDNLVNSFKEIFLCCHFTSGTNSKHTSFCADRPIS